MEHLTTHSALTWQAFAVHAPDIGGDRLRAIFSVAHDVDVPRELSLEAQRIAKSIQSSPATIVAEVRIFLTVLERHFHTNAGISDGREWY